MKKMTFKNYLSALLNSEKVRDEHNPLKENKKIVVYYNSKNKHAVHPTDINSFLLERNLNNGVDLRQQELLSGANSYLIQ